MSKLTTLFKVRKFSNYRKNYFGFHNAFFRIAKNKKTNEYHYLFFDFMGRSFRQLHKGVKIPINGLQITIWCFIFNLLWIPFILISYLPFRYFDGAKNFVKDSAWYQNVRFFNWVNIFIILLLLLFIFNR